MAPLNPLNLPLDNSGNLPVDYLYPDLVAKAQEMNALNTQMFGSQPNASQASVIDALTQARIQAASLGIDPEAAQPSENLFWKAIDYLGKPQQYMYGLIEGVGTGKLFSEGIGKTLWDADARNLSASDLLAQMGWSAPEGTPAPLAMGINATRGIAGFVVDVATDPLGLLGGLTRTTKALDTVSSLKDATNVAETVKVAGKEITKQGGDYITEINNILNKKILNPKIAPDLLSKRVAGEAVQQYTDKLGKVVPEYVASPLNKVADQKTEDIAYSLLNNLDEWRKLDAADPSYVLKSDIIMSRINEIAAETGPHADDMLDLFARATNNVDDIFNLRKNTEAYLQVQVPFLGFATGKSDLAGTLDRWRNADWGAMSTTQKAGYGTLAAASTIMDSLGYANLNIPLSGAQTLSKQAFNIGADIAVKYGISQQNMDAIVKQATAATAKLASSLPPQVVEAATKIAKPSQFTNLEKTYQEMLDLANAMPDGPAKTVELQRLQGIVPDPTQVNISSLKSKAGINPNEATTNTYQQMRQWLEVQASPDSLLSSVDQGRATAALTALDEQYAASKLAFQANDVAKAIKDKQRLAQDTAKWVGGLFSHGMKYGKAEDVNARYFAHDRAASSAVARTRVMTQFEPWANLNEAERFNITAKADTANGLAMEAVTKTEEGRALFEQLGTYETMTKGTAVGPTLDDLKGKQKQALTRLQEMHDATLNQMMADGLVDPETTDFLNRSRSLAKQIRAEELAWGVETPSTLGVYIPKRYLEYINDAAQTDNLQQRKYTSFMDALLASDKAPSYDAVASWLERVKASQGMIAQKRYAKRMALVHGLKPEHLIELQNAARLNPRGPEADLLYNIGEDIPMMLRNSASVDAEIGSELKKTMQGASMYQKGLDQMGLSSSYADGLVAEAGLAQEEMLKGVNEINAIVDPSAAINLINAGEEAVLTAIQTQSGIKNLYVPKVLRDAYEETDGTAKWLERWVPRGSVGDKYIKLFDNLRLAQKGPLVWMFAASHMTNAISDRLMAFMRGGFEAANPLYSLDIKEALDGRRGITLPSGAVLKGDKLKEMFERYGFVSSPRLEDAFLEQSGRGSLEWMQGTGLYGAAKKAINSNKVTAKAADAYAKTQDWATNLGYDQLMRRQMFVHHLKNGAMPQEAARLANNALIDYRDMTSFEKSIAQRMMLFYGFLKGSTKMAILDLVSASPAINRQVQASKMMSQLFSTGEYTGEQLEENVQRGLITSGIQESMGFITGKTKDGLPEVTRVNISPLAAAVQTWQVKNPRNLTSFSSVFEAIGESVRGTSLKLMSQSNPVIKNAFELLSNKSSYYDMPLSSQFLRKLPDITSAAEELSKYPFMSIPASVIQTISEPIQNLLGAVPVGNDGRFVAVNPVAYAMISGLIPAIGRTLSVVNKAFDPNQGIGDAILSVATPLRPDAADLEKIGAYREINELKSKIEAITGPGKSVAKQRLAMAERQANIQ